MDLSLVFPIYNEEDVIEDNVLKVYNYLKENKIFFEIILSDDGSTDTSLVIIKKLCKKYPQMSYVTEPQNKGKGYALTEGLRKTKGDILLCLDVDLDIDFRLIVPTLNIFKKENVDVVIGSKFLGSSEMKYPTLRFLLSSTYSSLARTFLGMKILDFQVGFKAFKREVFKEIIKQVTFFGWTWDTDVLFVADRLGYKIKEIPVRGELSYRSSSLNLFKDSFVMLGDLFRLSRKRVKK
ncbi:glycosyltransferase [archaeon]|nr:glycosyltransferase [archaeon]